MKYTLGARRINNLILISTIVTCHFDKLHSSILKSCKCLDVNLD
jgi:hypothetical protein